MFICQKCSAEMKCTKTGRAIAFKPDTIYFGDEFTCSTCNHSVVYSNSKPSVWQGALARLKDEAAKRKIFGFKPDYPIEVTPGPNLSPITVGEIRDLNLLAQRELESILGKDPSDASKAELTDKFSEEEIIRLLDHPKFDEFTVGFREKIWESVSKIFKRELDRVSSH
jgi:hypothetical protein